MNLLEKIMNVCGQQMACAEVFCPYLACSFGAHIFNLHNNVGIDKEYPGINNNNENAANICGILKPRNVKMNVILVSPPGLSKNESINRFVDSKYGILNILHNELDTLPDGRDAYFCRVNGEITSAGFVGTIKAATKEGETNEEYGDAYLYRKGILAYSEIASLFGKAEHSTDLINHVLRVMGDNQIIKRLAHIDITHDTWVTIWGGIQPARIINIDNSGMDRRAVFVFHEWTDEEIQRMVDFRADKKTPEDMTRIYTDFDNLKLDILSFVEHVKDIKTLEWTFNRKQFATMPADLDVIEGLCIGYNLMVADEIDETLEVKLYPELERMLNEMRRMKDNLKMYEGIIVSIKKLKENKGITTRDIYINHFKRMGYTYSQCKDILGKAHMLGFIKPNGKSKGGGTKWDVIDDMVSDV